MKKAIVAILICLALVVPAEVKRVYNFFVIPYFLDNRKGFNKVIIVESRF